MEIQREIVANAVARWAGDASPSPFNERHGEFPEFIDLLFAVEAETEAWVDNAPAEYLDSAISLWKKPPSMDWSGWGAFNGRDEWGFYLKSFLEMWADRFPAEFAQKTGAVLEDPL